MCFVEEELPRYLEFQELFEGDEELEIHGETYLYFNCSTPFFWVEVRYHRYSTTTTHTPLKTKEVTFIKNSWILDWHTSSQIVPDGEQNLRAGD